jgi:hypothetical protein
LVKETRVLGENQRPCCKSPTNYNVRITLDLCMRKYAHLKLLTKINIYIYYHDSFNFRYIAELSLLYNNSVMVLLFAWYFQIKKCKRKKWKKNTITFDKRALAKLLNFSVHFANRQIICTWKSYIKNGW